MDNILMPFKSITVKMASATHVVNVERIVTHDGLYKGVVIDEKGGRSPKANGDFIIGVLLETFSRPNLDHRVLVSGVVPMKIEEPAAGGTNNKIELGDKVMISAQGNILKAVAATTGQRKNYVFGIALGSGEAKANDTDKVYIPVLLRGGESI